MDDKRCTVLLKQAQKYHAGDVSEAITYAINALSRRPPVPGEQGEGIRASVAAAWATIHGRPTCNRCGDTHVINEWRGGHSITCPDCRGTRRK